MHGHFGDSNTDPNADCGVQWTHIFEWEFTDDNVSVGYTVQVIHGHIHLLEQYVMLDILFSHALPSSIWKKLVSQLYIYNSEDIYKWWKM